MEYICASKEKYEEELKQSFISFAMDELIVYFVELLMISTDFA